MRRNIWLAALAILTLAWNLTISEAVGAPPSPSKSGDIEPTVAAHLRDETAATQAALKHARLTLRVVELASGDEYQLKMNPDTSRKWHRLVPKTRDEVNAILDSVDLTKDSRGLRAITQQLVTGRLIADSRGYEVVNIITDGNKVRETWDRGGSVAFDGKVGVVFEPANRQAKISRFGQAMTLRRFEAGIDMLESRLNFEDPTQWPYQLNDDGTPRRWITYGSPDEVLVEQTMYGYKQYSDAVTFPTVQITASYDESNVLYWLMILVIEEAKFDPDLAPDAFRVAVPRNTAVWTELVGLPGLRAVTEPVDDVVKFVVDGAPGPIRP
jgi:hypothetical protein